MTPEIVCIVDDDALVQFTMKRMIESGNGTQKILAFTDGEQLYEYLLMNKHEKDKLPDVIFLDINMPYMDGWEFMERFKEIVDTLVKEITIYILSSSVSAHDMHLAKSNPYVKNYITKPVSKNRIQELLQ